jgi:hypothetical protein
MDSELLEKILCDQPTGSALAGEFEFAAPFSGISGLRTAARAGRSGVFGVASRVYRP